MAPGTTVKHVASGKVVTVRRVYPTNKRGVTKVQTSGDFGPLDVRAFEVVEEVPTPKPTPKPVSRKKAASKRKKKS